MEGLSMLDLLAFLPGLLLVALLLDAAAMLRRLRRPTQQEKPDVQT
jgi:hypothetical protein